jgi:hypothetical protein
MNHRSEKKRLEIVQPEKQKRKLQKHITFAGLIIHQLGKKEKTGLGPTFSW